MRSPERFPFLATALLSALPSGLAVSPRWELEARVGGAWSAPVPIVIRQQGEEDLRLTARWRTEAFAPPIYYAWRVARWSGRAAWALGLIHHKVHLRNPPAEVHDLSVSHGYNLVALEHVRERDGWRYGVGAGAVLAHPESEVRGRRFEGNRGLLGAGYYVAGPTAGVFVGRSHPEQGRLRAAAEARLTLSHARVPIAGGSAHVPNLAAHASVGLGWWARP